ncbi:MAG: nucleotidyltransferase family protein [Pacificimonas sp.]
MTHVSALILAGSRPASSETGLSTGPTPKPLIEIAGRPMIAHVVDALSACAAIEDTTVVAQDTGSIRAALGERTDLSFHAGQSSPSASVLTSAEESAYPLLVTTADHPLLQAELVTEFIHAAAKTGADVVVGVVTRDRFAAQYPRAKRTWLTFRDDAVTGANLFYLARPKALAVVRKWREVEQDRKKGRAILSAFGPRLALGTLFRVYTFDRALEIAGKRLGATVAAVRLNDVEAAIDVDKEEDRKQVEAILASRRRSS